MGEFIIIGVWIYGVYWLYENGYDFQGWGLLLLGFLAIGLVGR